MENVVLYVGFEDVFFGEKSSETLSSDRVNSAIKCIATRSFKTGNLFSFSLENGRKRKQLCWKKWMRRNDRIRKNGSRKERKS